MRQIVVISVIVILVTAVAVVESRRGHRRREQNEPGNAVGEHGDLGSDESAEVPATGQGSGGHAGRRRGGKKGGRRRGQGRRGNRCRGARRRGRGCEDESTGPRSGGDTTPVSTLSEKEREYLAQAAAHQRATLRLFNRRDEWEEEKQNHGATVFSTDTDDGTVYRLETVLDFSPDKVLKGVWDNPTDQTNWNEQLASVAAVATIDDSTDIVHNTAQSVGIISSRDFVQLRHWGRKNERVIVTTASVEHEDVPPQDCCVRAENKVGTGMILEPVDGNPEQTKFTWIVSLELHLGWIAGSFASSALPGTLIDFVQSMKGHIGSQ